MDKLIITCAITGAETTRAQNPALPVTPDEQARAAFDCWKAGASIIHLHVRDENENPSQSVERFEEAIAKIRKKCPVVIQVSTGGAVGESIEKRAAPLRLKPEMASLNTGSINFGNEVFVNLSQDVESLARKMKELKIIPEIEVYDLGMLEHSLRLMKKGTIPTPSHFQFVLGTSAGLSGDVRNICEMASRVPETSSWAVAGIGRYQLSAATHAILMGGHVRVGLEDNIYWSKGVLAKSNAQLVERVRSLAETLQRDVASVDETRKMLGL